MSGRFGAELGQRKRPSSDAFNMSAFGTPYSEQHIKNIMIKLKLAPMPNRAEHKTRKGHPLFLYRPDKSLTGDDGTDTVLGLADVNYGLHQRVVYQEMKERGLNDQEIPYEVVRHSQWPITVDEFLKERMIVPIGIRDQQPNDPRFPAPVAIVPSQVEGLAHGVPWIWGALTSGNIIGFRLGEVELTRTSFVDPEGKPVGVVAKRAVLQLTPMVLLTGAKYHGSGDGHNPATELDFPQGFRVDQYDRALDEFGLPLGNALVATKGSVEYKTRGSGYFFTLGFVGMTMGKHPSEESTFRAIRTYAGMNAIINTHNRVAVYLTPHTRLDRHV